MDKRGVHAVDTTSVVILTVIGLTRPSILNIGSLLPISATQAHVKQTIPKSMSDEFHFTSPNDAYAVMKL